MGFAQGGISYKTYFVNGELPSDFRSLFLDRVRMHRFEPLQVDAEEDVSYGWVPIDDPLSDEFQTTTLFLNQYVVLALRMDRWAVPPALLKAVVKNAEREKRIETKRDHLSRTERGEILDRERVKLKKESLPAVRLIDFYWNVDTGQLRFGTHARAVNEVFCDLFERTFSLELVPDGPYISALHCGLEGELIGQLADVEPARFTS